MRLWHLGASSSMATCLVPSFLSETFLSRTTFETWDMGIIKDTNRWRWTWNKKKRIGEEMTDFFIKKKMTDLICIRTIIISYYRYISNSIRAN